jgi:hypothetical protein
MSIPLISQTMRPALHSRHTSRFLSARRTDSTRSTWRSYGLEHRRRQSTSQPGRGSGGPGEVGDSRESIIPLCYALLDTHCVNPFLLLAAKTVGRQNGCRVSEPQAPVSRWQCILLEHQSLTMYLRPVAVSPPVASTLRNLDSHIGRQASRCLI